MKRNRKFHDLSLAIQWGAILPLRSRQHGAIIVRTSVRRWKQEEGNTTDRERMDFGGRDTRLLPFQLLVWRGKFVYVDATTFFVPSRTVSTMWGIGGTTRDATGEVKPCRALGGTTALPLHLGMARGGVQPFLATEIVRTPRTVEENEVFYGGDAPQPSPVSCCPIGDTMWR
ncbi:MAG: hypothetical protein KatS3mg111_0245 [Pirellulaceae bacterium]|nr:MAG: hypothetical protein KatS3mg111_0245 [Pirellulaceae bacterium]